MTALAISTITGAPISTWILDSVHWWGMAGWRWLFILEGLPAVILGIVTYWYLSDRPEDAGWLKPEERDWLSGEIKKENNRRQKQGNHTGLASVITDRRVWHLAFIYCMLVIALYGLGFWMPQIIRSMDTSLSNTSIGLVMVIPYACAGVAMILWSRHSDRTGERRWHTAFPPLVGGIALAGSGMVTSPLAAFLLIIIATVGIFCAFGPFWTLPSLFLAELSAAAGIAVINSVGNACGFIGPTLMGYLTQATGKHECRAGGDGNLPCARRRRCSGGQYPAPARKRTGTLNENGLSGGISAVTGHIRIPRPQPQMQKNSRAKRKPSDRAGVVGTTGDAVDGTVGLVSFAGDGDRSGALTVMLLPGTGAPPLSSSVT